jgi:hypothetical protein
MKVEFKLDGFATMLFIIFLILKLTDVINWSWWYVTLPLWLGPAIGFSLVPLYLILKYWEKKRSGY